MENAAHLAMEKSSRRLSITSTIFDPQNIQALKEALLRCGSADTLANIEQNLIDGLGSGSHSFQGVTELI
jgi:hypothetical protein